MNKKSGSMSLDTDSLLVRKWLKRQLRPTPRVCYADFWRGNCIWRWLISRDRKKKRTQLPKWDVSKDTSESVILCDSLLKLTFHKPKPWRSQAAIYCHKSAAYKPISQIRMGCYFWTNTLRSDRRFSQRELKQTSLSSISLNTHDSGVCIINSCMSYVF